MSCLNDFFINFHAATLVPTARLFNHCCVVVVVVVVVVVECCCMVD
jgi:hypothetical protein